MATTIAAQLQAIKSSIQIESDPIRRPFTRPSIIFDPKEASDIDVETILSIALTGLEDLIGTDARFESYKNSLFSQKTQELDREIMGVEENKRIDASVSSYLRLLAGYLHLRAGVKTLEYLIRRYKVHVYNIDELLLCSLPYHDSPTFVRIVQLLEFRNDKWHFLEGVRVSGAPPPRKVIVQQCIRDKGVLEALCNYASPTKRFHQSMPVIGFCTAVIVEALGAVPTLDPDIVNRVIPFLFDGLDLRLKGDSDHKAGAMMIAGLLASRATLPTKVVHGLIMYIARIAHQNGKESADLPLLRLSVMTIITLVQSESVQQLPKRCLDILKEIRDLTGVLRALSKEFNIDRFLSVYLEALVDNSSSDDSCRFSLITTIEMVNVKDFVVHVVVKVLGACMKLSKDLQKSKLLESGSWAKQILVAIDKNYPTELRGAVRKFLEDPEVSSMQEDSLFNTLHLMLDGNTDMPTELSHSKIWFTLEHPKAEVRRASLLTLASSGLLDADAIGQHNLINVQEAMLRRLCDDDLTVVHAALSVDGLSCIIDPHRLIKAFQDLLSRCIDIVISVGSFGMPSQVFDVAVSCLEYSILNFKQRQFDFSKEVATMIFPLLLILPKTWRLSIKALDLVKEIAWPFFATLCNVYDPISASQVKKFEPGLLNSINTKIVGALAESFLTQPGKYMPWLIECCSSSSLSKPLFLLVLLQSFMLQKDDVASFSSLFQVCFPVLKSEWCEMEGDIVLSEEFDFENPDQTCSKVLDQLFNSNYEALNSTVLVWIYWSILKAFTNLSLLDTSADFGEWQRILQDLFVFSVTSPLKHVYKEQHHLLVMKSGISPVKFLSNFFADEGFSVAVQATSLESFATICSLSASSKKDSLTSCSRMQLLHGFPLVLVALSSNNQDIRMSALNCIEGLYKLWCSISNVKSGNETVLDDEFGQFMELIVDYRKLISSDVNFLPSFLTSVLGFSSNGLFAPQNTDKRFNQCAKENILHFILSYSVDISAYGKLKILSLLKGVGNAIMHVEEVKKLLIELLERRSHHHVGLDRSCEPLSQIEIETLCVILECCFSLPSSFQVGDVIMEHLFRALQVDGASSEDPAIIRPCLTVLKALTPALYNSLKTDKQDELFQDLIILHRNDNGDIQNAAREALLQINVRFSSVSQLVDLILAQDVSLIGSSKGIKKKKSAKHRYSDLLHALSNRGETMLSFLGSLLDVLLQKKDIESRASLVEPLFKLLGKLFKDKWLDQFVDGQSVNEDPSNISHIIGSVCYVQQAALMILEDICASLSSNCPVKDDILDKFDVTLLVDFARSAKDAATRNHVFLLLSSVAKLNPDQVLDNIIDIFTLIGESAILQSDSYSQHVFKGLLSTVVPCWLSKTNNAEKLLQIFVNVLPEVAEHRRLTLVVYLLRTLGENNSLGTLLVLLIRSLVLRISKPCLDGSEYVPSSYSSIAHSEWEYVFAVHICEQYSCTIWLPSLVTLLKEIGMSYQCQEKITELLLTVQLILHKLQDIELVFKLESEHDRDDLQKTLGALMEQIVSHLQVVNFRSKQLSTPASVRKELKERMHIAIKTITDSMTPSAYFKTITLLLGHADGSIRKKALGILCEAVKGYGMVRNKRKETQKLFWKANSGFHMDGSALESFNEMCLEIVRLIDGSVSNSDATVKLAAISSLEVLANKFSSHNAIFVNCLTSVAKHIGSDDLAISSSCLRSTGALVHVLGLEALPELTHVMVHMLTRAHDVSSCSSSKFKISGNSALSGPSINKESLLLSILVTLEAVIDKLGGFLNPYLVDIIDLLVIHSEYVSESDTRVKTKADSLRRLVTEKIPVRLILNPLLNIYPEAVMHGESSLSVAFEMLASTISTMDRSSVGSFHAKIFEQCLLALDLRRQHPVSITNIDVVEQSVIHAIIALTMKLTETMFRPIFIRCLEWAESGSQESELCNRNLDRSISFFKLVDKLAEKNRSLFVPYFKYLLEGCTRNLTDDNYKPSIASTQKRKKAKVLGAGGTKEMEGVLSRSQWHLRALILSSLNKCFVYDTGNLKFLDSLNFQVLLKPIVSQLAAEPPETLEHLPNLPTVNEVDDILVCCLGQMAVTAGSDLLWKPLNHEVLMQTRSGKLRTMILSLRVVKYLIEHLKEEYVVLLPETIPFLGELLEDVNLPVRTMAQEILKELETLSGEDLKQYLR